MSKLDGLITINYNKKRYTIATINHSNIKIPILMNRHIYKIIKSLDKTWYVNEKNHIYYLEYDNVDQYPIYLHEIIMKINHKQNIPILHINNIHFDNRIENLQFDVRNKNYSKNTKKKNRTIDLSKYNINVNELPTYMWYLKPDQTHGSRFVIDIQNQAYWRSTASKKVSLRYKLEESKKYLRHLKQTKPNLFDDYSMNGDLTKQGLKLYKEYYMMIRKAGFTMNPPSIGGTLNFLRKNTDDLTDFEIYLLEKYNPEEGSLNINQLSKNYNDTLSNSD